MDGTDQLEVSEWTLPGPSVGEVTEEGVGASCQPPFTFCEEKKTKDKIIKCVFQHSSECKDAGDRLQTPSWNLNESNHDEFPHYKHAFARSESQSEAVKRNDIMLHITSHFQNMIFKRQMMEESIIANYHIG